MAALLRHRTGLLAWGLPGLVAAAIVGATSAGHASTALLDAVLADVNGAVISASDAGIARALGLFGITPSDEPIRTADVDRLVDAWLIEREAARLQILPSSAEVEEAWQSVAGRVGSADALRGWLEQADLDEAWVKKLVEADLRWRRFIDVRFRAFVFVPEEDVTQAIGSGPHAPEIREKTVDALREDAVRRELTAWLAEARAGAVVRTTDAAAAGLALPFSLPTRADRTQAAPR